MHQFWNVFDPDREVLETHAYGIGAPTKAYAALVVCSRPKSALTETHYRYSMTKYVQESAINFPLRIMVQETPDGKARIVYDLPSTQIPRQDEIPALKAACAFVDQKIEQLMRYVSGPVLEKVIVKELPRAEQHSRTIEAPKSQYVPSDRPIPSKPLVRYTAASLEISSYVKRTARKTIVSVRPFRDTIKALHVGKFSLLFLIEQSVLIGAAEINFFYPIHSDEMVEKAVAANSAKVFDDQIVEAQAGLKLGYL